MEAEIKKQWAEDRVDEAYFLETFATAVAEHLVRQSTIQLCNWAEPQGMTVCAHNDCYELGIAGSARDRLQRERSHGHGLSCKVFVL